MSGRSEKVKLPKGRNNIKMNVRLSRRKIVEVQTFRSFRSFAANMQYEIDSAFAFRHIVSSIPCSLYLCLRWYSPIFYSHFILWSNCFILISMIKIL